MVNSNFTSVKSRLAYKAATTEDLELAASVARTMGVAACLTIIHFATKVRVGPSKSDL